MPKYVVELSHTNYYTIIVEADDPSDAREAALEQICDMDADDLVFDHCDGFQTTGCELVTEPGQVRPE